MGVKGAPISKDTSALTTSALIAHRAYGIIALRIRRGNILTTTFVFSWTLVFASYAGYIGIRYAWTYCLRRD